MPHGGYRAGRVVGRELELDELRAGLARARGGETTLIILSGEAGVGKTTLADVLLADARSSGDLVAVAAADGIYAPPLWPWTRVVSALGEASSVGLPEVLRALCDGPDARPAEPAQRFAVFDAVARVLHAASAQSPVVVVLDDLHLADVASVEMLRFITRALPADRLLLVATVRTPDGFERDDVRKLLDDARGASSLVVRPLPQDALLELVEEVAGGPLTPDDRTRVVELSGGNPLFATELARFAATVPSDARPPMSELPRTGAVVHERVLHLAEPTRQCLRAAAIWGRSFTPERVAQLVAMPTPRARAALAPAVAAGLLVPAAAGGMAFVHDVVRQALVDGIEDEVRSEWHLAAADLLLADGPRQPEAAARHLVEAGTAEGRRTAVALLEDAARHACVVGAYDSAETLLGEALRAAPADLADDRRADVLLALADVRFRLGDRAHGSEAAVEAAALARGLADARRLAQAAIVQRQHDFVEPGRMEGALVSLLEEALVSVGETDLALRAELLAYLSIELSFSGTAPRHQRKLAEEAVRMAVDAGDDAAELAGLRALAWVLGPAELDLAETVSARRLTLALRSRDRTLEVHARAKQAAVDLARGDVDRFDVQAHAVQIIAEVTRQPLHGWIAGSLHVSMLLRRGLLDEGRRLADATFERARQHDLPNHLYAWVTQHCAAAVQAGNPDSARPLVEQMLAVAPTVLPARCLHALVLAQCGDAEAAAALRALVEAVAEAPPDALWLPCALWVGWACAAVDHAEWCARLRQLLEPYARQHVSVQMSQPVDYWGEVQHVVGRLSAVLGEHDRAGRELRAAAESYQRIQAHRFRALALSDLAALGAAPTHVIPRGFADRDVTLRRRGAVWEASTSRGTLVLPDAKGLRYLAHLIRRHGQDVHVLDLVAAEGGGTVHTADAGPRVDALAQAAYRRRLEELRLLVEEREDAADLVAADVMREEMLALARELSGSAHRAGRSALSGSAERARMAVSKALTRAVAQVHLQDPELADHLRAALRTGVLCSYRPAATDRVRVRVPE